MGVAVVMLRGSSPILHAALGPFFGRLDVEREMGAPLRNAPNKRWWLAFDDGAVVGFCGLDETRSSVRLVSDYVAPKCRGRRIYDRMFRARIAVARKLAPVIRSTCTNASRGTFERYGFCRVRQKGAYHAMEMINE